MRTLIITTGAACALALPAWAQTTAAPEARVLPAATTPQAATLSQERLQAMRNALAARIAVYDTVEKSYRAPTAAERAALSGSAAPNANPRTVALANGGVAIKGDAGEISFLVVELQPDGKAAIGHAGAPKERASFAARPQPVAARPGPATQPAKEARHAE